MLISACSHALGKTYYVDVRAGVARRLFGLLISRADIAGLYLGAQ